MKVGDLVRIKQGSRSGKLAIVVRIDSDAIRVVLGSSGEWFGYYSRDLELISEGR